MVFKFPHHQSLKESYVNEVTLNIIQEIKSEKKGVFFSQITFSFRY